MALAAFLVGPAWARSGVIAVTDGTTSAVQGADLQAGQRITTGADGRAHLMFVDGSAVTVGPNSALRIDSYAYDPASKTGAMALGVEQGMIRFVGGAISKTTDVRIATPSGMIGVRGGIAAVTVAEGGATTADFLHGSAMRVESQGITQTATRAGSQASMPAGDQARRPFWDRANSPACRHSIVLPARASRPIVLGDRRGVRKIPGLPRAIPVRCHPPPQLLLRRCQGNRPSNRLARFEQAGLVQQTVTTPVGIVKVRPLSARLCAGCLDAAACRHAAGSRAKAKRSAAATDIQLRRRDHRHVEWRDPNARDGAARLHARLRQRRQVTNRRSACGCTPSRPGPRGLRSPASSVEAARETDQSQPVHHPARDRRHLRRGRVHALDRHRSRHGHPGARRQRLRRGGRHGVHPAGGRAASQRARAATCR